jgi:hypothetical protein
LIDLFGRVNHLSGSLALGGTTLHETRNDKNGRE